MKLSSFEEVDIREFNNRIGDMDLFLLDYILKGEVDANASVLDVGSGSGRNLLYFLREGFNVTAIDQSESEVISLNFLSRNLVNREVCIKGSLIKLPFVNAIFDFIICSRVLHFAKSEVEFFLMLQELRKVVGKGGAIYLSMDSQIGMETRVVQVEDGKYRFPDGNIRFTLTVDLLRKIEKNWKHLEIPRTVLFDNEHAETTLILTPS